MVSGGKRSRRFERISGVVAILLAEFFWKYYVSLAIPDPMVLGAGRSIGRRVAMVANEPAVE